MITRGNEQAHVEVSEMIRWGTELPESEADMFRRVHAQNYLDSQPLPGAIPETALLPYARDLTGAFDPTQRQGFVARRDGEIAASMLTGLHFSTWAGNVGEIQAITVPDRHGMVGEDDEAAIACMARRVTEYYLAQADAKRMRVMIDGDSEAAIDLFQSLGFKKSGFHEVAFPGGSQGINEPRTIGKFVVGSEEYDNGRLLIRRAMPYDNEKVYDAVVSLGEYEEMLLGGGFFDKSDVQVGPMMWHALLSKGAALHVAQALVANEHGRPNNRAGAVVFHSNGFTIQNGNHLYIEDLFAYEPYRGGEYRTGSALTQAAINAALDGRTGGSMYSGIHEMRLGVLRENPAVDTYLKWGGVITGREELTLDHQGMMKLTGATE